MAEACGVHGRGERLGVMCVRSLRPNMCSSQPSGSSTAGRGLTLQRARVGLQGEECCETLVRLEILVGHKYIP